MECRVLESKKCTITQGCKSSHVAVDLVKEGYKLDNITAHSDGKVVQVISNCNINTSGESKYGSTKKDANNPGNMVKIDHGNGYYTRYLHLAYNTVKVKNGDTIKAGQILGYMGNTGYSFGGHLHLELWATGKKIDPTPYLNKDLPGTTPNTPTKELKYKENDVVTINGVYVSSTSDKKLTPLKTTGKITKIIEEARNPYLLDNGEIGWVNDDVIIGKTESKVYKIVTNCYWLNLRTTPSYGNNIYKAVKAGTKVEYLGKENGWSKVKYEGKTLYCGESYLK